MVYLKSIFIDGEQNPYGDCFSNKAVYLMQGGNKENSSLCLFKTDGGKVDARAVSIKEGAVSDTVKNISIGENIDEIADNAFVSLDGLTIR